MEIDGSKGKRLGILELWGRFGKLYSEEMEEFKMSFSLVLYFLEVL